MRGAKYWKTEAASSDYLLYTSGTPKDVVPYEDA